MEESKENSFELDFGEGGIITMKEYLESLIEEMRENLQEEGFDEEFISTRINHIRSGYNSIFRLMVKKHNKIHPNKKIKFNDLMSQPFMEIMKKAKDFQDKFGISTAFPFLEK